MSDLDTFTHISNGILEQKLSSFRTIKEASVLSQLKNPTIILTPQTLLTPALREIFADATSVNALTNRAPRRISRTGIGISIPISTPIHSVMSKYPTPDSSDRAGTRGTRTRISVGTTSSSSGLNLSPKIDNIQQSATPDLR